MFYQLHPENVRISDFYRLILGNFRIYMIMYVRMRIVIRTFTSDSKQILRCTINNGRKRTKLTVRVKSVKPKFDR